MVDNPYSVLKKTPARYRTVHFQQIKDAGGKFAMLTCYDAMVANVFDEAGIETLLIGDSLGNVVQGQNSTLGVTMEDMITFSKAVVAGTQRGVCACRFTVWFVRGIGGTSCSFRRSARQRPVFLR